jgi:hypothetical protein
MSQKTQRKAARNSGVLGSFTGGPKGPVSVGRGALARAAGTLGAPASLGGLTGTSPGFRKGPPAARTPSRKAGGALGAGGIAARPSNLSPRPGRGANGVLALAATPAWTARDRIRTGYAKGGRVRPSLSELQRHYKLTSSYGWPPTNPNSETELLAHWERTQNLFNRFSPEQQEDVLNRLRGGESPRDVAKAYGVNMGRLDRYLQQIKGERSVLDLLREMPPPGTPRH